MWFAGRFPDSINSGPFNRLRAWEDGVPGVLTGRVRFRCSSR